MANYGINIELNIKKQQKLNELNKQLDATGNKIDGASKSIRKLLGDQDALIRSYNDLNKVLSDANKQFNRVALGTPQAKEAARNLINANNEVNKGLEERAKLLKQVSTEMAYQEKMAKLREKGIRPRTAYSSPIGPMQMMTVNNNPRIMRNIAASQAARGGTGFGAFSESIRGGGIFPTKKLDAVTKSINRHAKNISRNIGTIVKIQTQQASGAFTALPGGDFGISGGQIGPRLPIQNRLGFGKNATGGPFAMQGGAMGRLKGGVGSALIGGGFPALFGAGGLSSVFGAVAGGAGGALAPGGGFAASIAATAIAAQIEKAREFNKAIEDLNRSIAATGGQSRFTAGQVNEFAESMRMTKEEALEALKAFEQFGAAARISLIKVFGDEATFNMLASFKDSASILDQMDEITKSLGFEQAGLILQILDTQGARAAENKILELTVKKNKELNMQIKERVGAEGRLRKIRKEQRAEDELRVQQEINNARTILELQTRRLEQQEKLAIMRAPIDEMERLSDVLFQVDALGKSIGDSFSESFKGIVSGSMTAQQALRNLFQRTADHFLDMAAQMLAAQIRSGIFGIFKSFMGLGPLGNPLSRATNTSVAATGIPSGDLLLPGSFGISTIDRSTPNVRGSGMFGRRASGGPVMGGGSYLVGERGPELFSPGVSGTITPNHAMGGTNIVVNVDASGSNVQGDEDQGRELGRLISVAVQSEIIQQQRPGGLLA